MNLDDLRKQIKAKRDEIHSLFVEYKEKKDKLREDIKALEEKVRAICPHVEGWVHYENPPEGIWRCPICLSEKREDDCEVTSTR